MSQDDFPNPDSGFVLTHFLVVSDPGATPSSGPSPVAACRPGRAPRASERHVLTT